MSILDTLKKVKEDGFDPKKDNISGNGRLNSGTYPVRLKSSVGTVDKKDREQIQLTFEVISGDFKDRLETMFISFDEDIPKFVLERNGKTILKIADLTGITFTNSDLKTEHDTAEALARGIGKQLNLKIDVRENKNNPDFPYRNYEFSPLEADPFEASKTDPLDELPF